MCGSGVGCFVFAPLANVLLAHLGWKGANMVFAALCLSCAICGALMRPLELVIVTNPQVLESSDKKSPESEPLQQPKSPRIWVEEAPALREEDEVEIDDGFFDIPTKTDSNPTSPRVLSPDSLKVRKPPGSSNKMTRNVSTPGFGRLTRLDSINERQVKEVLDDYKRRASSYIVFAVEVRFFCIHSN